MFTNKVVLRRTVGVWAGSGPLTRRVYMTHGLALAIVKYLGGRSGAIPVCRPGKWPHEARGFDLVRARHDTWGVLADLQRRADSPHPL